MKLTRTCLHTINRCGRHGSLQSSSSSFHTTATRWADAVDHYEVLGLQHNASQGDIKKQFYSLSKTHHPDHNPDDPQASNRFVKISEAYAILGNPDKRQRYDRDTQRSQEGSQQHHQRPQHSYSSASAGAPFGARPASGLSRRRSQFKGPPPSFYRSGGWGAQSEKRRAHAEGPATRATQQPPPGSGMGGDGVGGGAGGMGPGQGQAGFSNDVPHFDQEAHHRTQAQEDRRRRRRFDEETLGYDDGGSTFGRFVIVAAIVMLASTPLFAGGSERRVVKKSQEENSTTT